MTRLRRCATLAIALVVCAAPVASAQARAPRFEISGGALFLGGYSLASAEADLTPNQSGGSSSTLFESQTKVDSAGGFEARVGYRLSRRFTLEGGVFTARPKLTTRLSGDIEGASNATVSETLSVYVIDGALMVTLGSPTGRVSPFLRAGAGYVRELHDDNILVETGYAYHAGGGATFWLNSRRTVGARVDGRVLIVSGGIDFDNGSRTQGLAAGHIVLGF